MELKKMDLTSNSGSKLNLDALYQIMPSAFTEVRDDQTGEIVRKINFNTLRELLGDNAYEGADEEYGFKWVGKNAARREASRPINKTLRPCPEESVDWENTQNLYIEGDNLEVLKLLQKSYLGKVKMIYIDPPYNTGNDFVYRDDFAMKADGYDLAAGNVDELGFRYRKNNDSQGRLHSIWCSMIYERLLVARSLLSEDGVIFISIDDNEVENLKKICNEVFGERNIEFLIWNKEAEGSSGTLKATTTTRRIHEFILCAFKNLDNVQFCKIHEALKGRENEFQTANLAVNIEKEKTNHPNYFTITNPSGDSFTRQWKWSKLEIEKLIKEDLIFWGSDGHKQPRLIIPTDERRTTFLLSILNYGGTTVGRKDFELLMGCDIEFSYPKPVILLRKLIETATNSNSLILDFFSGSATTAHAVMKLNAEDGGNRKFIMVQLPEKTDEKSEAYKAGYENICEIGKERIRRAGRKIKEENAGEEGIEKLDIGFRVFKCENSFMNDIYFSPNDLTQANLFSHISNIKEGTSDLSILFGCMLDWGVQLSLPLSSFEVKGKTIYNVNDGDLLACFAEDVDENIITAIAELMPLRVVFRDSCFSSVPLKMNLFEIFKQKCGWSEEMIKNRVHVI